MSGNNSSDNRKIEILKQRIEELQSDQTKNPIKKIGNKKEIQKLQKEIERLKTKRSQKYLIVGMVGLVAVLALIITVMSIRENAENAANSGAQDDTAYELAQGTDGMTVADIENVSAVSEIEMPNDSSYYKGSDWDVNTLTEHFKNLGFANIEAESSTPSDGNFENSIFWVHYREGFLSSLKSWNKGDKLSPETKIVFQYNSSPTMTVDNSPDLKDVLASDENKYVGFAKKYDGCYVIFDAVVTGNDSQITVKQSGSKGSQIIIQENVLYVEKYDRYVSEGDAVIVKGKINKYRTDYFRTLVIDAIVFEKKE